MPEKTQRKTSRKIRVGILFGGKSAEHEVSLQSAKNIVEAIDKDKYELALIGIDKKGRWSLFDDSAYLLNADDPKNISLGTASRDVALIPGSGEGTLTDISKSGSAGPVDVIFPALHGPFGEDGTVQGLLKLADIPFVGASVLGSSVGMDKDVMKRLLRDARIPIGRFLVFHRGNRRKLTFSDMAAQLGRPFFVKPANYGSSVGVSMVRDESEFEKAVQEAFEFDHKAIFEEYIEGREIECSVLGNDNPVASVPGEVKPTYDFYSYEAKYLDENGALLQIPAELDEQATARIQELAVKTFEVLCCEGLARVDFFLKGDGEVIVNELNTIPGFTRISMYPRLWEASGISYPELIDRLIQLAFKRHEKDHRLKTDY
ncbi:MAG: D-alanine--D-alanine ligase [Deltaproteobacteria bacterium]|nr:D-alanine--D-alanine ligase [Deltaproteobacteria bacterium]